VTYVALLRAINAGIALPMADLRQLAADLGLANPRTYIASGNLLFDSDLHEEKLKPLLEARLKERVGKPVATMIRTGEEMATVAAANPFADEQGSKVVAIFLDSPPHPSVLADHRHRAGEQFALGTRELYVFYPEGMGRSRLLLPSVTHGTARNLNTVAKLAALAQPG
jgi:uncharacterized protein (DUF1697 family)